MSDIDFLKLLETVELEVRSNSPEGAKSVRIVHEQHGPHPAMQAPAMPIDQITFAILLPGNWSAHYYDESGKEFHATHGFVVPERMKTKSSPRMTQDVLSAAESRAGKVEEVSSQQPSSPESPPPTVPTPSGPPQPIPQARSSDEPRTSAAPANSSTSHVSRGQEHESRKAMADPQNNRMGRIMQQDVALREAPISVAATAAENFQAILNQMQALSSFQFSVAEKQTEQLGKVLNSNLEILDLFQSRLKDALAATSFAKSDDNDTAESRKGEVISRLGEKTIETIGVIISAIAAGGRRSNRKIPPLLRKMISGDLGDLLKDPKNLDELVENLERFRKEHAPKSPERKQED